MEEIFKPIKDFPNYQISNLGNVKNIKRNKLLISYPKATGYMVTRLSNNNISKEKKIHRLVAQAFIDNPKNLEFVNHKDEIKNNNHFNNLEWCDSTYNNNYGTRSKRQAEKMKISVKQFSLNNIFIKEYTSINEAGKCTNNNPSNISNCLKKRSKTSGGYIWKY